MTHLRVLKGTLRNRLFACYHTSSYFVKSKVSHSEEQLYKAIFKTVFF